MKGARHLKGAAERNAAKKKKTWAREEDDLMGGLLNWTTETFFFSFCIFLLRRKIQEMQEHETSKDKI